MNTVTNKAQTCYQWNAPLYVLYTYTDTSHQVVEKEFK